MNIAFPPIKKKLTKKQEIVANVLADPSVKTISAAAQKAGVSRRQIYRMYENPQFEEALFYAKQEYANAIEDQSSEFNKIARMLREGIDAKKYTKYGSYPDHRTRLKYVELVLRIRGILPDSRAPRMKSK